MGYKDEISEMRHELRALYKAIPAGTGGFNALSAATKTEGPLSVKEREYVALGIAIALRCSPCVNFHIEALMKAGGTREELGAVLGMTIQMGGGPSLMYAAHALAAWDELAATT